MVYVCLDSIKYIHVPLILFIHACIYIKFDSINVFIHIYIHIDTNIHIYIHIYIYISTSIEIRLHKAIRISDRFPTNQFWFPTNLFWFPTSLSDEPVRVSRCVATWRVTRISRGLPETKTGLSETIGSSE